MTAIYIVSRCYDYEGSVAFLAFDSEAKAEAFQKLCSDYHETRPRFPDDEEGEAAYDNYCEAEKKWRESHPGGELSAMADFFRVEKIEML